MVLSCDNALPHLFPDGELRLVARNPWAKLAPGGLLLVSIRDDDALLEHQPQAELPRVFEAAEGRRIVFQVWDWEPEGPQYLLHHFILRQDGADWWTTHRQARYRALRRSELSAMLGETGFRDVRWQLPGESGYYQPVVTAQGVATVPALAVTAVFPAAGTVLGWARARRPEVLGVLSLLLIGLSLVVALATDNPSVVLLRGSVSNAMFALLCFGSLALARPLMFYVARQVTSGWDRVAAARFDAQWQQPGFRRAMRRMTGAWGCWLLAEAAGRALAVLLLPVSTFLATWPVVANVGTFAMIYWSMTYGRRAEGRTVWAPSEHSALLSERGRRALDRAGEEARRLNHNYIGTEHLLLGLFDDGGTAGRVLRGLGVTPEAARVALDAAVPPGRAPSLQEIAYTPRLRAALGRAVDAQRAMGASQIGTEHLLFGLAALEDGLAAVLLTRIGSTWPTYASDSLASASCPRSRRRASARPALSGSGLPSRESNGPSDGWRADRARVG